eukprot:NODE_1271_length_995_cov_413.453488_g939_i1.p1 GENE.NODE_1271_length_995_cov_413.453488_g939_i1~~NODE_1271_length_995_cov_413.453488_g939_i1.p1  ORF type:complete len:259 (+),score=23.94 NODE_1271_length_995_cov_413.453488_g939_i1:80-856(+)
MMRAFARQHVRCYSSAVKVATAQTMIGGLATNQIRDVVGGAARMEAATYKMPAYLAPKIMRPVSGCYDDKFIRENYIKPDCPEDPYNYRGRCFQYAAKVPMWAVLAETARVVLTFIALELSANKSARALSNIECDISAMTPGKSLIVLWRGKPVFIRYRLPHEIEQARDTPLSAMKDPQTDQERFGDEGTYSVMIGICTHLGCVPVSGEGAFKAFLCPCHGSHYDHSGRIRKGPAPLNLEVPPYKIVDGTLFLGDAPP